MRLDLFVEGPLLRFAFAVFFVGVATRLVFFLRAILEGSRNQESGWRAILGSLGRSLFPFHSGVKKKPLYALLRYIFHTCLFVVPVFLFAHVVLWEESRFQWGWTTLPDTWADRLTLLLLVLCATFLVRRMVVSEVRRSSTPSDYLFIVLVSMPFLTGYLLSHGVPGSWPFLEKNMWTLHVLSGEILLVSAAFLFVPGTWCDVHAVTGFVERIRLAQCGCDTLRITNRRPQHTSGFSLRMDTAQFKE